MPSSVISSQSMHLGVLATASHAVLTQTIFVVYYKPRSDIQTPFCPWNYVLYHEVIFFYKKLRTWFSYYFHFRTSQFIIGLNKYLEAQNHDFGVGIRFKMRFEGDDSPERRLFSIQKFFIVDAICRVAKTFLSFSE